jgi:hypothetical protein
VVIEPPVLVPMTQAQQDQVVSALAWLFADMLAEYSTSSSGACDWTALVWAMIGAWSWSVIGVNWVAYYYRMLGSLHDAEDVV